MECCVIKKRIIKDKKKFHETGVKPAIIYKSEYWMLNKKEKTKIKVAELKMLM